VKVVIVGLVVGVGYYVIKKRGKKSPAKKDKG
jgi:hypothetical protein